jgi:hypothetical protein
MVPPACWESTSAPTQAKSLRRRAQSSCHAEFDGYPPYSFLAALNPSGQQDWDCRAIRTSSPRWRPTRELRRPAPRGRRTISCASTSSASTGRALTTGNSRSGRAACRGVQRREGHRCDQQCGHLGYWHYSRRVSCRHERLPRNPPKPIPQARQRSSEKRCRCQWRHPRRRLLRKPPRWPRLAPDRNSATYP